MNCNIPTALEIFADRTYEDDATLTPRSINDSLITDPNSAKEHVKAMLIQGGIISRNGDTLKQIFIQYVFTVIHQIVLKFLNKFAYSFVK